jgi:hypothetical protein
VCHIGSNSSAYIHIAFRVNWVEGRCGQTAAAAATYTINLIFIGVWIVIYSYSTTNTMHLLFQIIYSCKTLYVFWSVFPSIIRSSKLCIQQRYMLNSCRYLLLSGIRQNPISSPTATGSSSCFDIYHCCIRGFELLMMD